MEGQYLGLEPPDYEAECYPLTWDIQSQNAKNTLM
jgi:hypothetical protein